MKYMGLLIGLTLIAVLVVAEIIFHGILQTTLFWTWPLILGLVIALELLANNYVLYGVVVLIGSLVGEGVWLIKYLSKNPKSK